MKPNHLAAAAFAAALAGAGALNTARVQAQTADSTQPPVLLVLDKDAIDYGDPPHFLPADAVDPDSATVGARDEPPYFQNHLGAQVVLTSGQAGNPGWFGLQGAPSSWAAAEVDGLQNFALAGPGLGSPDDNGDRESLLASVPGVAPLTPTDFAQLVGRSVCAVVYSGDIAASASTSLQGPTLGRIGFTVVAIAPSDDPAFPNIQVQIAEGHELCSGQLAAITPSASMSQ